MIVDNHADLGLSPVKKKVLLYTEWFASYNLEMLEGIFDEDIKWTLVGDEAIVGKENFINALADMKENKATHLTINRIINHGKQASVDGVMHMSTGNSYAFADFYEFSNLKASSIKSITSYIMQLK